MAAPTISWFGGTLFIRRPPNFWRENFFTRAFARSGKTSFRSPGTRSLSAHATSTMCIYMSDPAPLAEITRLDGGGRQSQPSLIKHSTRAHCIHTTFCQPIDEQCDEVDDRDGEFPPCQFPKVHSTIRKTPIIPSRSQCVCVWNRLNKTTKLP